MNKIAVTLLAALLCGGSFAATGPTEGVLEKGAAYSALFTVSPESGDLIGYAFKNQSTVGKAILGNCLPGMLCRIEKSATRLMADTSALKFEDNPSGWMEITAARDVGMVSAVAGYEKAVKTRYGVVSVSDDNLLLYRGKPVAPAVEGNSGLSIVASYELGKSDVLLLQNTGGSACPALFRFVTVGPAGVRPTPEFGTCSDIIFPTTDGKTGISVAMVGFAGPFESEAVQKKAGMTKKVFQYANGQIVENGRPIK